MLLSTRSLAIVCGSLCGGAILVVGIVQLIVPGYGTNFLQVVSSIYPGFRATGGLGDLLTGALLGVLDGAVGGFLFGWFYNSVSRHLDKT
jgi:hypothetical protein